MTGHDPSFGACHTHSPEKRYSQNITMTESLMFVVFSISIEAEKRMARFPSTTRTSFCDDAGNAITVNADGHEPLVVVE
jgi:hypothetical protein